MFDIIKPALVRAAAYFVPIILGAVFAWLASRGWGVWNADAQTWTITLSVPQITGLVVAFIGAPALALTAVFKGWKPLASGK
jgi:TRAP-type C4-dicarboxylate transport system permease small subunit